MGRVPEKAIDIGEGKVELEAWQHQRTDQIIKKNGSQASEKRVKI